MRILAGGARAFLVLLENGRPDKEMASDYLPAPPELSF